MHRPALEARSDAEIILTYNAELRGLVNYYALAFSAKTRLAKLSYIWTGSLLKPLAAKHKTTATKTVKRLRRGKNLIHVYEVAGKMRGIQLFSLRTWKAPKSIDRRIDVQPYTYGYTLNRPELIQRLNADRCEYCGRTDGYFEVHHVNKLKDSWNGKELWKKIMAAMQRKT